MSRDAELLRDTLELALAADASFAQHFYATLFARNPELSRLFQRNSPGAQQKMFAQKLTAIVDHLDEPGWLTRELRALASSHHGYGVTQAMYAPVGEALLETLRAACGTAWTADSERAWRAAYQALADAMVAPREP